MSKTSIPVIKFLFREDHRILGEALNIGTKPLVKEFSDSNELSTFLGTVPAGLIMASLSDRNDLIQIATFMKLGKKIAKDCAVKMVVFNNSNDRNFEKAISKLGIQDIVEPGINTKALKFKIDFWMKSLNGQIKTVGNSHAAKVKSFEAKTPEKKGVDLSAVNWIDALELEDDIWLINPDNGCKKILSKWLIKFLGPSPYVGQWVEVKSNLWRFDIKSSDKELYIPGEGAWFFSGDQKPDFVWKDNVWLISGDNFNLYFEGSGENHSRFQCKNKVITVCRNSLFAQTKESLILESLDKELVFRREAELLTDLEGKNKTEHLGAGQLSGKSETDQLDAGPLEGKSKTSSEVSGNLRGKVQGDPAIAHENLEQEIATAKEKSHWANKNTYQEGPNRGDLGGKPEKHNSGNNLERQLGDQEHKKHYRNHNEAERYSEGALANNLSGKSGTDHLPKHYDSKSPAAHPDKNDNDLSGKAETEKLKTHYRSPDTDARTSHEESKTEAGKPKVFYENWDGQHDDGFEDRVPDILGKKRSSNLSEEKPGKLLSLQQAKKQKARLEEESSLDELTEDARVISYLSHQDASVECRLDDFFDGTIIFHTDQEIEQSSTVSLDMKFNFLQKETALKINGEVTSVEDDGEGKRYVTVELSRENEIAFKKFMELYEVRQQNVTEFLKKARGL